MDVRHGHHATGCCAPHGYLIPIDHPDHEDHDPARERRKGGVRIAGTIGDGTAVVGIDGAGVSGPDGERDARAKGSLDANGVCRPYGGRLQCSSGKVVVCACYAASCRHVHLKPRPQLLQHHS
jgi:hypothetical protein